MKNSNRRVINIFALACGLSLAGCAGSGKTASVTPEPGGPTETRLPQELSLTLEASAPFTPTIDRFGHDAKTPRSDGDVVNFNATGAVAAGSQILVEVVGTGWKIPLARTSDEQYAGSARVPGGLSPGVYAVQAKMLDSDRLEITSRSAGSLTIATSCDSLQTALRDLTIHFETADSSLQDDAKMRLNRIAGILLESQRVNYALRVVGHTDDRGSAEYNLGLSEKRAKAAKGFLLTQGIPKSHVEVQFLGEDRPIVKGIDTEALRANRRAEFELSECR